MVDFTAVNMFSDIYLLIQLEPTPANYATIMIADSVNNTVKCASDVLDVFITRTQKELSMVNGFTLEKIAKYNIQVNKYIKQLLNVTH